ncbi:sulfatase-like hydrolase/transferase [Dyadobacter jejuensis]|uniref:sulfatase-like hydrolase/transferase n=1 Tax=Dyadobacter jejuensis TaxID=1082580 RepID=UPI001E4D90CB|nr:sulfatase-like hydrolase/transferase [Dyadobacter jejuensis]
MKISKTFVLSSLYWVGFLLQAEAQPTQSTNKPNVLFIFADDQRADALGIAGNGYIQTPHIDRLAKTGVRFENAYVMGGTQAAICAPSRAMLMSGKSLFHVYDKLNGVYTMPMHFSKNGYETFGTGKWHNGGATFEASFMKGKNIMLAGMSSHYEVPCRDLGADGKLGKPTIKGFSTDIFAESAIEYLNDYASSDKQNPFFCYVAFTAPHDPRSPRDDYKTMYTPESMPLPGNFKALHPFEFDDLNIRDETLAPWPRTPEIIQESLADYYALISHMDHRIGDIIHTLKKNGLFDNTIIVYAADNGLAMGSHGLLGKQDMYEHSTKVPLIISGPHIPNDKISEALVYLYDLFPTLSDLCQLPATEGIDGKSLMPIMNEEELEVRKTLYTVYRGTARAIRNQSWKLIYYPERNFIQLFNLKSDPLEINNLAAIPEFADKKKELMELLTQAHQEYEDTAELHPAKILPLEYDYKKLKQNPDNLQPPYVLEKYFKGVNLDRVKKSNHQ